jgi:hypothetical protein
MMKSDQSRATRSPKNFTLVVYDMNCIAEAQKFAKNLNLPCYPAQSVPDYLVKCMYSPVPLLPIDYYNKLFKLTNQMEQDDDNALEKDQYFCFSLQYDNYLFYSNKIKKPMVRFLTFHFYFYIKFSTSTFKQEFMDSILENQAFEVLWKQHGFDDAIAIMTSIQPHSLPEPSNFNCLIQFLMVIFLFLF